MVEAARICLTLSTKFEAEGIYQTLSAMGKLQSILLSSGLGYCKKVVLIIK